MNLRLNLGCGRLWGGRGGWSEGEEVKEKEATRGEAVPSVRKRDKDRDLTGRGAEHSTPG